jgi:hypothetical protein
MKLTDVQAEVAGWPDADVNSLAAFLAMLRVKRSDTASTELSDRLNDRRPESWMSIEELKSRLADEPS